MSRIPSRWLFLLASALALGELLGCTRRMVKEDLAWRALVDSHRQEVRTGEGLTVHLVDLGSGAPVVLIHGIADSTYSWHANARALVEAGFRVVLVDQPGMGRSSIPPPGWSYGVERQAEAILEALDRIGLQRFALVGHSLGGAVSLQLAWRHPDRLTRLAVLDPACFRVSCPFGRAATLLAGLTGTRWFTQRGLRSAYYRSEKVDAAAIDEYARLLDAPGRLDALGGVCKGFFSAEFDRMVEGYRGLEVETLVVWGDRDSWHPPAMGARLQGLLPRSRLEWIPEAGHNAHQERPDLVNPILIRFLRGA